MTRGCLILLFWSFKASSSSYATVTTYNCLSLYNTIDSETKVKPKYAEMGAATSSSSLCRLNAIIYFWLILLLIHYQFSLWKQSLHRFQQFKKTSLLAHYNLSLLFVRCTYSYFGPFLLLHHDSLLFVLLAAVQTYELGIVLQCCLKCSKIYFFSGTSSNGESAKDYFPLGRRLFLHTSDSIVSTELPKIYCCVHL